MTARNTGTVEGRGKTDGTEFKIMLAAQVHGVSFEACFFRFVSYFGGGNNKGIIGFADKVGIAVMVAVTVADDNVLAFDIFRFSFFPGVPVEKRIKYDGCFTVG